MTKFNISSRNLSVPRYAWSSMQRSPAIDHLNGDSGYHSTETEVGWYVLCPQYTKRSIFWFSLFIGGSGTRIHTFTWTENEERIENKRSVSSWKNEETTSQSVSIRFFHWFPQSQILTRQNKATWPCCLKRVIFLCSFVTMWLLIIIIIIIIMSCCQHGYPWPSLATSPYRSSRPAGLLGYIPCPHIAAVCKFGLVVLLLLGHMWGSIGVRHLRARPCFSSSVRRVWLV